MLHNNYATYVYWNEMLLLITSRNKRNNYAMLYIYIFTNFTMLHIYYATYVYWNEMLLLITSRNKRNK